MSALTQNDEDTDDGDDVLLSSAFLSRALVPKVRFAIATIVVAIIVVTACSGDAIYYYYWLEDRVRVSLRVAGLYAMHPCMGNDIVTWFPGPHPLLSHSLMG